MFWRCVKVWKWGKKHHQQHSLCYDGKVDNLSFLSIHLGNRISEILFNISLLYTCCSPCLLCDYFGGIITVFQPLETFSPLPAGKKPFPVENRLLESSIQVTKIFRSFILTLCHRTSMPLQDTSVSSRILSSQSLSRTFMCLSSWPPLISCLSG